jgi:hypothetical protein
MTRIYFRKDGGVKGYYTPKRFCSLSCNSLSQNDKRRANAKGHADKHGYKILFRQKGTGKRGYQQPEHRAVMEQVLGRKLEKHETVHHKDLNRSHNDIKNLELWTGRHGRGTNIDNLIADQRQYRERKIRGYRPNRRRYPVTSFTTIDNRRIKFLSWAC